MGSAASTGWETRTKVRGTTEIHLAGYPTHIEGREQLTILTPEVGGSVKSETEYAFHIANATKETPAEPLVEEKIQQMETGAKFFTWGREASSESQEAKNEIGKTTIQEQLGELDQVFAAGQSGTPAELNTLEKIVELIRKDDSAVNAIVERLSRPEEVNTTDRAAALIGMLGAAGTVKAQETLIGMVNTESWPMEQRGMAIFSFAQVNQPAPAVDAWLRQLHAKNDELSNNSLLILGAVGNRVREENPERYEQIAELLDVDVGTVKVRVHRAMKQLREIFNELSCEKNKCTTKTSETSCRTI